MSDPTGFDGVFADMRDAIFTFFAGNDLSKYSDADLLKMDGSIKANAELVNRAYERHQINLTMGVALQEFTDQVVIQGVQLPADGERLTWELTKALARRVAKEELAPAKPAASADRSNRADVGSESTQQIIRPKKDGEGATPEQVANSVGGPTGGKPVPPSLRKEIMEDEVDENGVYTCWRCGGQTTDPSKIDIGHKITPRSKNGNLNRENLGCEGVSCNRSARNSGEVKPGSSCIEKGTCSPPPQTPKQPDGPKPDEK
jgi:hypothetical protein